MLKFLTDSHTLQREKNKVFLNTFPTHSLLILLFSVPTHPPTGTVIATGADDAKVKLWSAGSGFCFVTLSDHAAPVTAVCFGPASGRVLLSASLDGTVRAYDLLRYKNFRTLTSDPQAASPAQFISLAADPSGGGGGGSMEPFAVHVWACRRAS